MKKPLAGLTIVECSGVVPSLLGRMLVDLGAKVYKYQSPKDNDYASEKENAYSNAFDFGKNEVAHEEMPNLIDNADILLWDHSQFLDGETVKSLRKKYPYLIIVTLTPFGSSGPLKDRKSSDLVNIAMSGYLYMTGIPDETPIKPSIPHASVRYASLHAFSGLLLALRTRRLNKTGSHVDVAIRDAGLWMLVTTYQFWDIGRINRVRQGRHYVIGDMTKSLPLIFACRDGDVVWMPMAGRNPKGTIALIREMDLEGAATPQLLEMDWTNFELEDQGEIDAFLLPFQAYFMSKTREELFNLAVEYGVLLAPIRSFKELLDDPQLTFYNNWIQHPETKQLMPKYPVNIKGIDWAP